MVLLCRLLVSGIRTTVSLWYGIAGAYKHLCMAMKGLMLFAFSALLLDF